MERATRVVLQSSCWLGQHRLSTNIFVDSPGSPHSNAVERDAAQTKRFSERNRFWLSSTGRGFSKADAFGSCVKSLRIFWAEIRHVTFARRGTHVAIYWWSMKNVKSQVDDLHLIFFYSISGSFYSTAGPGPLVEVAGGSVGSSMIESMIHSMINSRARAFVSINTA